MADRASASKKRCPRLLRIRDIYTWLARRNVGLGSSKTRRKSRQLPKFTTHVLPSYLLGLRRLAESIISHSTFPVRAFMLRLSIGRVKHCENLGG